MTANNIEPFVPPPTKTRILLVEDHESMRSVVRGLIERHPSYEVCAEAGDGAAAQKLLLSATPDLAVVDISLPSTNGLAVAKTLQEQRPGLPILILSMHNEDLYAHHALRSGAMGYLMKHEAADKIHEALDSVRQGKVYASERILAELGRSAGS